MSIFLYKLICFSKSPTKDSNSTDFKTLFSLNFLEIKLLLKTEEDLSTNFEFGVSCKILDQTLITLSFIFLKLLNDPKVIKLFFTKGD